MCSSMVVPAERGLVLINMIEVVHEVQVPVICSSMHIHVLLSFTSLCFNRYDAVTYLKYLDSLRASESFRSVWIFAESSYKIFEYAKKRVYHFGRSNSGKSIGLSRTSSTRKRKLDHERNKDGDGEFSLSIVSMYQ